MASHRLGPFLLVDPPEGQVECIRDTLAAIDYPWRRLIPAIRADRDGAVLVKWDPDMQQGATGLYYPTRHEIHLGTRYAGWERQVPFVFAHEVGHLVDKATLRPKDRAALKELLHGSEETYRRDGERLNGEPLPYAHETEHNEYWRKRNKHYYLMLNEAYADLFVAAFAPSLWTRSPRFTHWTSDLDAVRSITLRRRIVSYTDTEGTTHEEAIEWATLHGLLDGYNDGTFRPNEPLTRGQVASVLKRFHKNLTT